MFAKRHMMGHALYDKIIKNCDKYERIQVKLFD